MSDITEKSNSRNIDIDGVNIHYHDVGTGDALIMLHGGGPGATAWSNYVRNIAPLAEHFRVIAPDLPGFGASDVKPAGSPLPLWYAQKMGQFIEALGLQRAHIVGNSLGGLVALRLAVEEPKKVDRLVLMGTAGTLPVFSVYPTPAIQTLTSFYDGPGPSKERLQGFVDQFVYKPDEITDDLIDQRMETAMQPHIVETPPMRFNPKTDVYEEIWRDARLTRLPHETMMIWGREDRVNPMDMAFVLLKQIPHARLYVLPQCGHWAQWEHPDEFNSVTLNFLTQ